jgi:hypothetical protein
MQDQPSLIPILPPVPPKLLLTLTSRMHLKSVMQAQRLVSENANHVSCVLIRKNSAGAEPAAIATAVPFSKVESVFPLSRPNSADGADTTFNVMRHWGNLAPLYSVDSFGLPGASPVVPEGCGINAVHLVMRHGARYPSFNSSVTRVATDIHAAASTEGFSVTGDLEFLATWTYKLGAEILTPFGRNSLYARSPLSLRYFH